MSATAKPTPAEAALTYVLLELSNVGASIRFAQDYEDGASSEDYAAFLNIIDTQLSASDVEVA